MMTTGHPGTGMVSTITTPHSGSPMDPMIHGGEPAAGIAMIRSCAGLTTLPSMQDGISGIPRRFTGMGTDITVPISMREEGMVSTVAYARLDQPGAQELSGVGVGRKALPVPDQPAQAICRQGYGPLRARAIHRRVIPRGFPREEGVMVQGQESAGVVQESGAAHRAEAAEEERRQQRQGHTRPRVAAAAAAGEDRTLRRRHGRKAHPHRVAVDVRRVVEEAAGQGVEEAVDTGMFINLISDKVKRKL